MPNDVRVCSFFTLRARQDTHSDHRSMFIPTLTKNELITKYTI